MGEVKGEGREGGERGGGDWVLGPVQGTSELKLFCLYSAHSNSQSHDISRPI